jgi:ligand-binding SRPBCC domain-containing protein
MALTRLVYTQDLPISLTQCWDFFSSPENLATITPEYLGFTIHEGYAKEATYAGQLISYTLRPFLGIPLHWVTEITQVQSPHLFIDVQVVGPYAVWHHEHRFFEITNGVKMVDVVDYKLPFGILGKLVNRLKVRKDVENIFAYRRAKLEQLFGSLESI